MKDLNTYKAVSCQYNHLPAWVQIKLIDTWTSASLLSGIPSWCQLTGTIWALWRAHDSVELITTMEGRTVRASDLW